MGKDRVSIVTLTSVLLLLFCYLYNKNRQACIKNQCIQDLSSSPNGLYIYIYIYMYIPTWSYENRVSKHFVIFLNFPCKIACLLCCLLMSFVFACFVVRDLCRSGCGQNYYLPAPPPAPPIFFVPTHNSLFNTSDSYLKSVRA